jgi:hypothetical protein
MPDTSSPVKPTANSRPGRATIRRRSRRPEGAVPDSLAGAVAFVREVHQHNVIAYLDEAVTLNRGGYPLAAAITFLFLLFASGQTQTGIKAFRAQIQDPGVAAACGFCSLPGTSAISGILRAIDPAALSAIGPELLIEKSGALDILAHPASLHHDSTGRPSHVFGLDATREVFRHAALVGEATPGRRRTEGFAAPGYTGHKRGETVVSRYVLAHSSGLWMSATIGPGNASRQEGVQAAIGAIERVRQNSDPDKNIGMIVRADGEFGKAVDIAAFHAKGIGMVSRWGQYQMLKGEQVRRQMAEGRWFVVPDGKTGPTRSALDLGYRDLPVDDKAEGETVRARFTVSRYRTDAATTTHGHLEDGYLFELFVSVGLDREAWPAPELVQLFLGRAVIENNFAQEDREMALGRTFCYRRGGQLLATLLGLFVMNWQMAAALRLDPLPDAPTVQHPRVPMEDPTPVPWAASLPPSEPAPTPPSPSPSPSSKKKGKPRDCTRLAPPPSPPPTPREALADARPEAQRRCDEACAKVIALLGEAPWGRWPKVQEGWVWSPDRGLTCPTGDGASPCHLRVQKGRADMLLRVQKGSCQRCPALRTCRQRSEASADLLVSISLPMDLAQRLEGPMKGLTAARRGLRRLDDRHRGLTTAEARVKKGPHGVQPAPAVEAGPLQPQPSLLLGAKMRAATREALATLGIAVRVKMAPKEPQHRFLAPNAQAKRHSRKSRAEREARYRLPPESRVWIDVSGAAKAEAVATWLRRSSGASPPT